MGIYGSDGDICGTVNPNERIIGSIVKKSEAAVGREGADERRRRQEEEREREPWDE
jgi:hypothetical protein